MFKQVLDPTGNLGLTVLVALISVVALLVMLAVFRITAWLATLIGSVLTLRSFSMNVSCSLLSIRSVTGLPSISLASRRFLLSALDRITTAV